MVTALIGAGLAGLAAARALAAAGRSVVVFDKGRGIGGRVATRRTGHAAYDHGAPLLHGLPADLLTAAGDAAAPWRDGIVGLPGNSGLTRALAEGLDLRGQTQVSGLIHDNRGGWRPTGADRVDLGRFDTVLVAVPQPQAAPLLGSYASSFPQLAEPEMAPEWTLMAAFDAPLDGPDWRPLDAPLALAVRQSGLPGRPEREAWVVHADPEFTRTALEEDKETVARRLVAAFRDATGAPEPLEAAAHRWRYARTARPLGRPCLWDPVRRLGVAGDWCLGATAGDAVASGRALAAAVLEA